MMAIIVKEVPSHLTNQPTRLGPSAELAYSCSDATAEGGGSTGLATGTAEAQNKLSSRPVMALLPR
jgi:hypothetical protein